MKSRGLSSSTVTRIQVLDGLMMATVMMTMMMHSMLLDGGERGGLPMKIAINR